MKVTAVVQRADEGGLEERLVTATFFVPMTGSTYGWHMDGGAAHRLSATTFEFQAPDIETMLEDARNIARGELLAQLAKRPLAEIADMLSAIKDVPWGDD